MLEQYFIRPDTIDRIRRLWFGDSIERYVTWMHDHHYSPRCVHRRVPLLIAFGTFADKRGAHSLEALVGQVDAYVQSRLRRRLRPCRSKTARQQYIREVRGPIEQFLRVVRDDVGKPAEAAPFSKWAPNFFQHLRNDRGLSPTTIQGYTYQLTLFERFVIERGVVDVHAVSAAVLDAFLAERRIRVSVRSLGTTSAALRAFLRYLFREGIVGRDISTVVEGPQTYALSEIPRSINAQDVQRMLRTVDRRSVVGKRDFAMLQLLVVYGLRAREVAALTLEDIDWKAEVLHVRARKAGHAGVYPLIPDVGEAVLDYLRHGRPETSDRRLFFCMVAPRAPITHRIVSTRAKYYLFKAGIDVQRPGSHTLRHSCAQRLVDAEFSLKVVGDFLGHRHASSTRIYSKVALETLREVALGDGEAVL